MAITDATSTAQRPAVQVRAVGDDIADAVAEFFRAVWDPAATPEKVIEARADAAAKNPVASGTDVPAYVFLSGGKVIGYIGSIPVSFWNGRSETPTYWMKGFMVLPEHRNGPVGFNVLKEILKVIPVTGAIAAAPPARRLFTALGFVECGPISNDITLLRPARVLSKLDVGALGLSLPSWVPKTVTLAQKTGVAAVGGAISGIGIAAWRKFRGSPKGAFRVQTGGKLPSQEELDVFWERTRERVGAAAVRNGTYLPWRYAPGPGGLYEAVTVREKRGSLVGVAIVKKPRANGDDRLRGIMVATLSDILFAADRSDVGLALLAGAEKLALRMGADALLCGATHPALTALLPKRAYARMPGNVYLLIRDPKQGVGLPTTADQWWITRGDCGADETF